MNSGKGSNKEKWLRGKYDSRRFWFIELVIDKKIYELIIREN